jgi:cell division septation protein DedD
MASRGGKSGGDFVLESRHLVGLFLLLVVIFGVVFTLGYLLGRSQYDSTLRAAVTKPPEAAPVTAGPPPKPKGKAESGVTAPPQSGSDWDFYHSAEPKTDEDHLQPPKNTVVATQPAGAKPSATGSHKPASPAKSSSTNTPSMTKGAIMLQVAALQRESDALALAQALQQKKFPAVVITPDADKYYRVQVGPYADSQSAANARRELEDKGFKSIIKR